jgi:F0F1-type ATP synthase delta subunit
MKAETLEKIIQKQDEIIKGLLTILADNDLTDLYPDLQSELTTLKEELQVKGSKICQVCAKSIDKCNC